MRKRPTISRSNITTNNHSINTPIHNPNNLMSLTHNITRTNSSGLMDVRGWSVPRRMRRFGASAANFPISPGLRI